MKRTITAAILIGCAAVNAQTLPQLTLPAGVSQSQFRVKPFASNLPFPYSMAVLPDKSVLVCVTDTSTSNGDYLFGRGGLMRLADPANTGTATAVNTVYSGLPFPAQGVRLVGPNLVAVSQEGVSGSEIAFLKIGADPAAPYTLAGVLRFASPNTGVLHMVTLDSRPAPSGYHLFFSINDGSTVPATVTVSGLITGSLALNSVNMVTVEPTAGAPLLTGLRTVATGLRNPGGIVAHPTTGELFINDNGADDANLLPLNADEINRVAPADLGVNVQNFGWPSTYTAYRTGAQVGNVGAAPLTVFQPFPNGAESLGIAEMYAAPPAFPAPLNNGIFVPFYGNWEQAGPGNSTGPLLFYSFATGQSTPFILSGQSGIGHLASVASTGDTLYVADMSSTGKIRTGTPNGIIYKIQYIPPSYTLSATTATVPYTAGTGTVTLTANAAWTASAPSWLTVNPPSGAGSANLTYSFTANPTTTPRTGVITIGGQSLTVTQAAAAPPAILPVTSNQSTYNILIRDANGAADITRVYFLVNPTPTIPQNTCHGFYDRATNAVYLYNDTLSAFSSAPNSQCAVALQSATAAGTDLTLALTIQRLNSYANTQQNLYFWAVDAANLGTGWVPSATLAAANPQPPSLVAATRTGQSVTLTARDPNGATDIARIYFLFNPTPTVPQFTCHGFYDRASNSVYLYNDSLTSLNSLQNSQCAIQHPTVTISGTDLTLILPVTLQPTYTNTNAYFWIVDNANLGTGWINATPAAPTVQSAAITANSVTITTSDPNGAADITRVYFLINPTPNIPQNTCHGFYDRPSNTVALYNDTLTSLASLQNSQCAILGHTATATGNDLTITLQLTVQPAYLAAGQKLFVWTVDTTNQGTGWVQSATYSSPTQQPPTLIATTKNPPSYTIVARDPNGAADIDRIYFLLSPAPIISTNGCHGFWDRATNAVYLYNDALTALATPPQNSKCAIQGFSLTASGTDLTLNLTLTQQGAPTNLWVWIVDTVNQGTGWQ